MKEIISNEQLGIGNELEDGSKTSCEFLVLSFELTRSI